MKKTGIFIALIMLFTTASWAQSCEPYFPMNEGTEFEITNYDAKGKTTGKSKHLVEKVNGSGDNISAEVKVITYDKKDKEVATNTLVMECKNGVFMVDMNTYINQESMKAYENMEMTVDASNLELPSGMSAGQKLKDAKIKISMGAAGGMTFMNMFVNISNRKVEAVEDITTSAGTFNCIKITQDVEAKVGIKVTSKVTEWYAKDVGMVRSESYNKKGKLMGTSELTSLKK